MGCRKHAGLPVAGRGGTAFLMQKDDNSRTRRVERKMRAERLAAALRENLIRRKRQARGRADTREDQIVSGKTASARGSTEET